MSYPLQLDEVNERVLIRELERRAIERQNGRCDYCGRRPDEPPCKLQDRHQIGAERLVMERSVPSYRGIRTIQVRAVVSTVRNRIQRLGR
jgi:hypothetical protein